MEELFRFQQVRQSQAVSPESQTQMGLLLYKGNKLSPFAINLTHSSSDQKAYTETLNQFARNQHKNQLINDLKVIDPSIRSIYSWLSFKSRPIKTADLKLFLASSKQHNSASLTQQWDLYADNLLVSIASKQISVNANIDFALLVRICYMLEEPTLFHNGNPILSEDLSNNLINEILRRPILLPPGVLVTRCDETPLKTSATILPQPIDQGVHNTTTDKECICQTDTTCQTPSKSCVCITTYISDLFIVKEELARFEAGEIADIENILAGELKVREHRTLLRSENTSENETETITNEERDHQVTEKFTLQSEVKNTIDSKTNIDAGVTATFKYGQAITVTPHANVTSNTAKSDSESIARSYAKEIVDRAVSKIQDKLRKVQISKLINELEEKDKHSIDNTTAGSVHRAGIFYWVNKVTHAQVFNYGKHMMFDVIVPEPAAIFKRLYEAKTNLDKVKQHPEKPEISLASITNDSYLTLLNKYTISSTEEIQPPNSSMAVQFAFSFHTTDPDKTERFGFSSNEFKSPQIPKGYKATSVRFTITGSTGHCKSTEGIDEVALLVHFGATAIFTNSLNEFVPTEPTPIPNKNWVATGDIAMNEEEGVLTLALSGFSTLPLSISGSLSVTCKPTVETNEKWKTKIYNLVMADYNRKLELYNASNKGNLLFRIKGRNPFLNREIERNEFKRHIISILMCNYFNGSGSMMENVSPCGYPEINFKKLELDSPIIQFFEQIFEWEYVTYLFYHSMWARKSKWAELIDEDSGDPLFDKFLMSGAARVQIPIRPGMEEIFNWFLKTGQIWGASGVPPILGDDTYVSMIQELKESKQCNFTDRPGLISATKGDSLLKLTGSVFYWDVINNSENSINLKNDLDREILLGFKTYRIISVIDAGSPNHTAWNIEIERPYEGNTALNLKHGVGALFVGAPWEIVIPTKLVYLKNENDLLPEYPLK